VPEFRKKIILTFIGHYLPGYKSGGPVRTISNMLYLLADNYDFKIITRDRDLLENKTYQNINVNRWNLLPNCKVFYHNLKMSLRRIINDASFDMYYLNSLFDYNFSIKVVLLHKLGLIPQKQIVLAPRGELLAGALSTKALSKRIFLTLVKLVSLYKNVIWHASSEHEESLIKKEFGENIITRVALDVPHYNLKTQIERTHKKTKGMLKILFISRIAKTKNLKFVIEVLSMVTGDFTLDIYGPIIDEQYWQECKSKIISWIKNKIVYKGIINNDHIDEIYPNYDLLFFPTLGESFGHVIFESLSFGTPVLCTETTPWNRLSDYNAGWNISLDKFQQHVDLIESLILLDDETYRKYATGCEKYLVFFKNEKNIIRNNLLLFEN
jgi:glycosyltransferase involved in cell wall biosynthesis